MSSIDRLVEHMRDKSIIDQSELQKWRRDLVQARLLTDDGEARTRIGRVIGQIEYFGGKEE